MPGENTIRITSDNRASSTAHEYARRYLRMMNELMLSPGVQNRARLQLTEFADAHPNLRASYISQEVDASYFADGSYGWQAASQPKLQGIVIEGNNLFEFIAFANGLRMHATPLETIVHVEEVWMEPEANSPQVMRACLFHSYPATTMITASTPDGQVSSRDFLVRLKYLRGF